MNLEVFNTDLVRLGVVNTYSMIKYTDYFSSVGEFELQCALNPYNIDLLLGEKERILWIEGEVAGIIQYSQRDSTSSTIIVRGPLLSGMLTWRYIYPQFNMSARPDIILRELVRANCLSGIRALPNLQIKEEDPLLGYSITYQQTGSYVSTECTLIGESHGLGHEVAFMPKISKFQFRVLKGKDRTHGNTEGNLPVVFSRELNNILSSNYINNRASYKSTALVAGEGDGSQRVTTILNDGAQGYYRRELYVDARDLQSVSSDEEKPALTEQEYIELLTQRGLEKLKSNIEVESFDSVVRNDKNSSYIYGRDYTKGDIVTVIDKELGVSISAIVSSVTITQSKSGYIVEPTFGYGQPTLSQKLKQKGVL